LDLTYWLSRRTGENIYDGKCARQWRLLEEGFDRRIAEAYRDGMTLLWRITNPERPKQEGGNPVRVKYITILAINAVGLEAATDPDWTSRLSDEEAARAARHGCLSQQAYPDWVDSLIDSHPRVVLRIVNQVILEEWKSPPHGRIEFLFRYGTPAYEIAPPVQESLYKRLLGAEPSDPAKLDRALNIVSKLDLDERQAIRLVRSVRARVAAHVAARGSDYTRRYLALLFFIDPDSAISDLENWLGLVDASERQSCAEAAFGNLFNRHEPSAAGALRQAPVPALERLLRLVYSQIRPEQDLFHEGSYSPTTRDHAQDARDVILTALLDRPGADAFHALQRIADEPQFSVRAERFRQLARGKAERDAELPDWNENEVVRFERDHTAPVKTGTDLFRVVVSVFEDIQFHLTRDDVSSRPLLLRAKDEDEVRNWIVEQMNYRSGGRFHAHREAEVALRRRPDIIISATSASCEVAVEVKHGGKPWTVPRLESALRNQLAGDYLKPSTRRHGVFIVTHHGKRSWRDPNSGEPITFTSLIRRLDDLAKDLGESNGVPIVVRAFGIDASDQARGELAASSLPRPGTF
jgi:hypothetical protein